MGGGDSPSPTPDFAGHRGSLQGKNVEFERGTTDSVSFDVGEFECCPKIF